MAHARGFLGKTTTEYLSFCILESEPDLLKMHPAFVQNFVKDKDSVFQECLSGVLHIHTPLCYHIKILC